ncbi:MAG TPA: amidohydrolase [Planctomycetaceae bacterium]|nr:amidohydrolase [Planctomycetaceae bacterium]
MKETHRHWIVCIFTGMLFISADFIRAEDKQTGIDIIDCHTHFYDPTRPEGIPWPPENSSLYRTVLPQHLRELKKFQPVTGTVIVEAVNRLEDNTWLLDLAKDDPFIVGIVGRLDPGTPEFAQHVSELAKNPLFRGIRVSVKQVKAMLEQGTLKDFQLLADLDLSLDVNGGPETPQVIADLAEKVPNLRIVLNHIGNVKITTEAPPSDWQSGIQSAAKHPNVYCKVSALVEGAARDGNKPSESLEFYRPYIDVVWNAFGNDHVIYGSNWPVSERAADYETLQRIVMEYATEKGKEATKKFCSLNAKKAYKWVEREGRR